MSLKAGKKQEGGSNFVKPEPIKKGTYPARLVQMIDLGVQPQVDFSTKEEKPPASEVWITLEFPTKKVEVNGESRPRWVSKRMKISWHEKANFPKWMEVFGFKEKKTKHLSELLGNPCLAVIGITSGGNNKIDSVMEIPEGMNVNHLENDAKVFDFDEPDMEVFNTLPTFLQEVIKGAKNYPGSILEKLVDSDSNDSVEESFDSDDEEDEIPF